MIKMVFAWRDRPGMTPGECDAHYRSVHAKLARDLYTDAEGFRALIYNRVTSYHVQDYNDRAVRPETPDIDAFVEIFFDTREQMNQVLLRPELDAMHKDHAHFMDVASAANIRIYSVDEMVVLGQRPG